MGIARVLFRVGLLVMVVIVLAGCMEALKTDGLDDPNRSGWLSVKGSPTPLAWGTSTFSSPPAPAVSSPTPVGEQLEEPAISLLPTMTPIPAVPTATAMVIPPTETATTVLPVSTPKVVITLPTAPVLSPQELWRSQQHDRVVFDALRSYRTTGSTLWWYDPINQYHVALGSFSGTFVAQAQFRLNLNGQTVDALEVPYQVNQSYGVQALSPVLLDRIRAAGYGDWIDTYVVLTAEIQS